MSSASGKLIATSTVTCVKNEKHKQNGQHTKKKKKKSCAKSAAGIHAYTRISKYTRLVQGERPQIYQEAEVHAVFWR